MYSEVWQSAPDFKGHQRDYRLYPELSTPSGGLDNFSEEQLDVIHDYEAAESAPRKAARKLIDLTLSWPGTLAAGAGAAYEAFSHHVGGPSIPMEWLGVIGAGAVGAVAYQPARLIALSVRASYHYIRDPFSPAAQSSERSLQKAEDFLSGSHII